jgi:UDP-glucose 4-epimerase
MRALITGGAGFIGSHLIEALLERGDEVHIIDDLTTGNIDNIEDLRSNKNFHYTIDTVMNVPVTAELVDKCDIIFHMAAAVGVRFIVESPVRTIETNVKTTEVVLNLANKKKKLVLLPSTSEVYGKSEKVPYSEGDDLVIGPTVKGRWSYACSKALDEFLALAYWKEKKLPVIILRLFNTVGPRQTGRYGMVMPTFVKQALLGRPITVFGTGKQSRTFCHVKDSIRGMLALVDTPEAVGQIFNLGGNEEISMEDLALKTKELTGSSSEIVYIPYQEAYEEGFEDMFRRVPDITKINSLIGYEPRLGIEDMIRDIMDYFKNSDRI